MDTQTAPARRPSPLPGSRPATPRQLQWLRGELTSWTDDGLVDASAARQILATYSASRRLSVGRLLLFLGAGFVGVGVIWLVAANLDQLGPLGRFVLVAAGWLGLLVGAEALDARSRSRWQTTGAVVVVTALRTLAALVLGAVLFQAAQALQVPAWEPALVGWWAAGAVAHAYAVRSAGPLLVGIGAGMTWFLWVVLEDVASGLTVVLALVTGAVLAAGVAAVHTRFLDRFAAPWREVAAALALVGLFASALPFATPEDFAWNRWLVAGVVAATLVAVAGAVLARGRDRVEPRIELVGSVVVAALAVLLVLWDTGTDTAALTTEDWLHAVVSVGVYVVVAVGVAVLGTLRDSRWLTGTATAALVAFTTFQSFAVFARLIEGAWLFVVLGLVFLGTGVLFDRARRRLAAGLDAEQVAS